VHRGFRRLHRVVLIVDRRRRAREVVDRVDFDVQRERHVVTDELEPRVVVQMVDVPLGAREQVVDAQHFVALLEQAIAQV
jgi:hypothetical protein